VSAPLTDAELEQLLEDAGGADKRLRPVSRNYQPLVPRITRLLGEARELRDQQSEREFHYHEEAES
jgi:hypothetical protein